MILIISSAQDEHTRRVVAELDAQKAAYFVLDLSKFPINDAVSIFINSHIKKYWYEEERKINLKEVKITWWRRPQHFKLHSDLTGGSEAEFAYNECHATINGLWTLLDSEWVNDPVRDEIAARKIYQLKVAKKLGLQIPETLVSNHQKDVEAFVNQLGLGHVIYKSFTATVEAWRETRLLKKEELANLDDVKFAPVIFQEYIEADIDLRITVIGQDVFASAVHSQATSYKVDYRMTYQNARIEAHELPKTIKNKLLALMKTLGLIYGAIDMRLKPNGDYVFLEINPAGQWLFMEEATGQPITKSLVKYLIDKSKS